MLEMMSKSAKPTQTRLSYSKFVWFLHFMHTNEDTGNDYETKIILA